MRPVIRGGNPQAGDFADYQDARPFLISRIGAFCSYCERRTTPLHVEHIQPKSLPQYAGLIGRWETYLPDGTVQPGAADPIGTRTLALTGLNKPIRQTFDDNGILVATDRVGDRMTAWGIALESKAELAATPTDGMRRQIVRTAMCEGFFSIWMKVFEGDNVMRQMLIDGFGAGTDYRGFAGTAKDCFDANTSPVTPRPASALANSGKI